MNSKTTFALLVGLIIMLAAALIWEPAAGDSQTQGGVDSGASQPIGNQVARGQLGSPMDPQLSEDRKIDAALAARLGKLERTVNHSLVHRGELERLRLRVAQLERSQQPAIVDADARSQAGDISQLKRDIDSLKRLHSQLAAKVASARNESYPTRNDLRVLQQKVFSLETTVDRLEARR